MPAVYEAQVVGYLDRRLSLVNSRSSARRMRVTDLRDRYTNGIALLDQLADGDFTAVSPLRQDFIVSHTQLAPFARLLLDHLVEAIDTTPRHLNCCDDPPSDVATA